MLQFPHILFRLIETSLRRFIHCSRGVLAIGLAALLFFAPLSLMVSGQEPSLVSKTPAQDHFILYKSAHGETVCREATLLESRALGEIQPRNLRQINHLSPDSSFKVDNAQSAENVLPDHLTIILRGTAQLEANGPAKAAFIRAAQTWENQVKSPVTIYLDVDFGPKNFGEDWDPGTIGATSPLSISALYQSVRNNLITGASTPAEANLYNTLPSSSLPTNRGDATTLSVSASIARAIGLMDPTAQPTDPAARIAFNSAFLYDFDPNDGSDGPGGDGIDLGKTDFEAVATHEIGHALGFTSRAGRTQVTAPAIWDIFRFRTGTTLNTFGSAQRIMTADGLQYHFDGNPELGLSTGGPNGDAPGGDGNQSSHWKEKSKNGFVYIGIMDPTIDDGERRQITNNDTKALNSFGYNLDNNNPPPPPPPPPPVPANNDFANAQTISGCTGTVNGTNVGADRQTSEPRHDPLGNLGGSSVWYQWQAPSTGSVTITTVGSNYDTMLGVYTGNSVEESALTTIEKNDDIDTEAGNVASTVTFTATAGTVYKIAVDGWGGDAGDIVLNWNQSNCVQPNTAQLGAAGYPVDEGTSFREITVTRTAASGAATVDYSTNDFMAARCDTVPANASAKCDYATAGGTLRFAAGETSKTIVLSVIDDVFIEGNETLTITLSNATGTTLASPSAATITIQDNDTNPNADNPFVNNAFFVRMQYLDFLLREPDSSGFNDWMNVLAGCGPGQGWLGSPPGCDRVHVSSGFFRSTEFGEKGYWIYRFYESALGRRPQFAEFMPEMRRLSGLMPNAEQEARRADFISRFMQLPAFNANFNGLTDSPSDAAAFIAKLEQVGRVTLPASATTEPGQPPQYGRLELIDKMTSGEFTAAETLRAFIEQKVVWDTYFFRAFVAMQYFGYLRRDPEPAGYDDWVDVLTNGRASAGIQPGDYRHLIFGFVYSVEYRERFGRQ